MGKIKLTKIVLILFLIALNAGCDQLAKSIVRRNVEYNQHIVVIERFVTLTRVENTGAFLSMGDHLPKLLYRILMIIIPLIVLIYALHFLITSEKLSRLLTAGILLIIGGGLGNLCDRIAFGSVTDFLQFDFVLFHTGIVNLADISITAGFFIVIIEMIFNRRNLHPETSE